MDVVATLEEFPKWQSHMEKAVHSVWSAVGGDLEEMQGGLVFLYLKAVRNYNSAAGKSFKSYLYKVVWDDTFSARRIEISRIHRMQLIRITDGFDCPERRSFSVSRFMEDLSEEAQQAVKFVLDPPKTAKLRSDGQVNTRYVLFAIRNHFQWSKHQMSKVIEEIRSSLR